MNYQRTETGYVPGWMSDTRAFKPESYLSRKRRYTEGELGTIVMENRKGREEERISVYRLEFDKKGEPAFPYEKESELGRAEYEGMMALRSLAMEGSRYIMWMSPPLGRSPYKEGRLIIGEVIENQGKVMIDCRGMPFLKSPVEFSQIAKECLADGAKSGRPINRTEDLREGAMGLNFGSKDDFLSWCQTHLGMREVWEAIRSGKDVLVQSEVTDKVAEIWAEMEVRGVKNIRTRAESQYWVNYMKAELGRRGIAVTGFDHHGGGQMKRIELKPSLFNGLFLRSEIGLRIEKKDGKWQCPCGERVPEGTKRCPVCGLKLAEIT